MSKNNNAKENIQVLSKQEKKVFEKICADLRRNGWNPIYEYHQIWGWIIIATINEANFGTILRRIKPFALNSLSDFERALRTQERLRSDLVEIFLYRIFLGNKVSIPKTNKPFHFLSEADFQDWTKFFKGKKSSLEMTSIDVPKKTADD